MEAKELRTLSVEELRSRCRQWSEDLFRARFKSGTSEVKDTSLYKKLRKDIARAKTILTEKKLVPGDISGRSSKAEATSVGKKIEATTAKKGS